MPGFEAAATEVEQVTKSVSTGVFNFAVGVLQQANSSSSTGGGSDTSTSDFDRYRGIAIGVACAAAVLGIAGYCAVKSWYKSPIRRMQTGLFSGSFRGNSVHTMHRTGSSQNRPKR